MTDKIKIHNQFLHLNRPKVEQNIKDDSKYIPDEFKEVARNMESQFAQMMLKEMESTSTIGGESNDTASDVYKNWLNTERSNVLTKSSKLGVQDLVLDEIYPKKFRNQASYNQYMNMQQQKLNRIKRDPAIQQKLNDSASAPNQIQIKKPETISKVKENSHE